METYKHLKIFLIEISKHITYLVYETIYFVLEYLMHIKIRHFFIFRISFHQRQSRNRPRWLWMCCRELKRNWIFVWSKVIRKRWVASNTMMDVLLKVVLIICTLKIIQRNNMKLFAFSSASQTQVFDPTRARI